MRSMDHRAGACAHARDRRDAEHQSPPSRADFRAGARGDRARRIFSSPTYGPSSQRRGSLGSRSRRASQVSIWSSAWLTASPASRSRSSGDPPTRPRASPRACAQAQRGGLVDELRPGWDRDESRSRLAQRVVAGTADLTLVGIGPPQQEILAHELKPVVTGPITDCGAVIEVPPGMRPRAPRALQLLGLEWPFRLAIEPRRLASRYAVAGTTFRVPG